MKLKCIQGIRGWAIILIVLWHLNSIFPGDLPAFGDRGVEFFLLISGVLIGMKYYCSTELDNTDKCIRYSLKKVRALYPMYLISSVPMVLLLLKDWISSEITTADMILRIVANVFLIQSWFPDQNIYWSLNGVTWFLSSILFCYCVASAFFWLIKKVGALKSIVFLFLAEFTWEAFVYYLLPKQYIFLTYILPAFRALDFGIGICIGVFCLKKKTQNIRKKDDIILFIVLLIYIGMIVIFNKKLCYSAYHIVEMLLVWIIVGYRSRLSKLLFENRLINKLGDISDYIFLFHLPVIVFFDIAWGHFFITALAKVIEWVILLAIIPIVAILVQKIFEIKNKSAYSMLYKSGK